MRSRFSSNLGVAKHKTLQLACYHIVQYESFRQTDNLFLSCNSVWVFMSWILHTHPQVGWTWMDKTLLYTSFISEVSSFKIFDFQNSMQLPVDILKVDLLLVQKISLCHFLRDIEKPFQEVTPMGPEPHHFFSFWNVSTNMVARGIQSFGQNGP